MILFERFTLKHINRYPKIFVAVALTFLNLVYVYRIWDILEEKADLVLILSSTGSRLSIRFFEKKKFVLICLLL